MTQTTTTVSSTSVTPAIPTGQVTRVTDNAISVGTWSAPITVDTTSTFTAIPGTAGQIIVQLSDDSGVTWRNVKDSPFSTTVSSGVSSGATSIRATALGAAGTLIVDTPVATTFNSFVLSGGIEYLVRSNGTLMPLSIMSGTPHEPTVAAVVQQVVSLDHGSDADHVEILLTSNATTGDPDTADTLLASARFTSPDSNAEVVKTAIIGASSGTVMSWYAPGGITKLHFGLRGAGPYTVAASNTLTALQMVVMSWADALGVDTVEVRFGSPTVGGGVNKRYRTITVTGYAP